MSYHTNSSFAVTKAQARGRIIRKTPDRAENSPAADLLSSGCSFGFKFDFGTANEPDIVNIAADQLENKDDTQAQFHQERSGAYTPDFPANRQRASTQPFHPGHSVPFRESPPPDDSPWSAFSLSTPLQPSSASPPRSSPPRASSSSPYSSPPVAHASPLSSTAFSSPDKRAQFGGSTPKWAQTSDRASPSQSLPFSTSASPLSSFTTPTMAFANMSLGGPPALTLEGVHHHSSSQSSKRGSDRKSPLKTDSHTTTTTPTTATTTTTTECAKDDTAVSPAKKSKLNKKKKRKQKKKSKAQAAKAGCCGNVSMAAVHGCHLAFDNAPWLIDVSPFRYEDFGLDPGAEMPDISVDPETFMLTVINKASQRRCFMLTLHHRTLDKNHTPMLQGLTDIDGGSTLVTTFILVVPPVHLMDVCFVDLPASASRSPEKCLRLDSDVSEVPPHPHPDRFDSRMAFDFPLPAFDAGGSYQGYLCTQGSCGILSHFFPQTMHAIDFRCPVGTPILCIGDGVVTDVVEKNTGGGIHISNLYTWNSVTVKMARGVYVDYVHIRVGSARVKVGEEVKVGQVLCESGDVGFCPEPHLHVQVSLSGDAKACTEKFGFRSPDGVFFPIAGRAYDKNGEVRKEHQQHYNTL